MFTFRGIFTISKFGSERGGFQLMPILGLLGIYFDAVLVEVKTFSDWLWPYCESPHVSCHLSEPPKRKKIAVMSSS